MLSQDAIREQSTYRLVLVFPDSKQLLAEHEGTAYRVPRISIPKWTRHAEQISLLTMQKWNLKSIVLDFLPFQPHLPPCAAMEIRRFDGSFPADRAEPKSVDEIRARDLVETERYWVKGLLSGNVAGSGPFSRLGWIEEAQRWIRTSIRGKGSVFTDDIRQLNAGDGFSLVRFHRLHGPAYWLKATGEPNRHEFSVTWKLAEYAHHFLPPLVAARKDWNAWVMEEVGTSLAHSVTVSSIGRAGASLAELQKRTIGRSDELCDSGCFDQRLDVLRDHLPAVFDYLKEMTTSGEPEQHHELHALLREVEGALDKALLHMHALRIPNTVGNNDMKLANILSDGRRCVFTDWCHACVSNPFLTFQHLHTYLLRRHPELAGEFKRSYSSSWTSLLTSSQVEGTLALTPLVAPYAYLFGQGPQMFARRRNDPGFRKSCSRIVRHLSMVSQSAGTAGAPCR